MWTLTFEWSECQQKKPNTALNKNIPKEHPTLKNSRKKRPRLSQNAQIATSGNTALAQVIRWLPAFGRFGLSGGRLFPSAYETCFKSRHSEPKGNSCCRQSSSLLLRRRCRCRHRRRRCQVLLPTWWLQLEGLVYLSTVIGPTHTKGRALWHFSDRCISGWRNSYLYIDPWQSGLRLGRTQFWIVRSGCLFLGRIYVIRKNVPVPK